MNSFCNYILIVDKSHLPKTKFNVSFYTYFRRDLNHFMNKVNYAVTDKYGQVPTIRTTLVGKVFLQKPEYTEDVPKNTHVNVTPFDQRLSEI